MKKMPQTYFSLFYLLLVILSFSSYAFFRVCFYNATLFLFQRCLSLCVCPFKLQVEVEVCTCASEARTL